MIGRSKVIDVIVIILVILSFQLARIERILQVVLQVVCRNQVTTAKLLGQAHGISVRDKKP